jgi:hypothetical protein
LGKFCQIYQELKIKKQSLASLFEVEIKVKPMPIQVDIRKAHFYKWGGGGRRGREGRRKERSYKRSKRGDFIGCSI